MRVISLLCPTRGRPQQVIRLLDSLRETTAEPKLLEVLFYIDDDDPDLQEYVAKIDQWLATYQDPFRLCEISLGAQTSLIKVANYLYERCSGDVVSGINDDFVYRTKGWDTRLNEEADRFADDLYLIWFDDGRNGGRKCILPHISRQWANVQGYLFNEIFRHYFADTWLYDVAKLCQRAHYVGDVLIEHMHYLYGKSEKDQTYTDKMEGLSNSTAEDKLLYLRTQFMREVEAARILKAASEHPSAAKPHPVENGVHQATTNPL